MRVVVTGATGNIGTALLRRLVPGPDTGSGPGPDIRVTGLARRLPRAGTDPYRHCDWVRCDLGDDTAPATLVRTMAGADAVVHLAWAIHPRRGEPPMWRTNVTGTRAVLRAVAEAGVPHLVAASSVAAYSPAPREATVDEDWPRGGIPGSAYSRSKVWLERELDDLAAREPGTTVTRVRPCAVVQRAAAGEFTRWVLGALVPAAVAGRAWLPVPLWPGLRAQVVHADDVARAVVAALSAPVSGAVNLAADPVLGVRDLAGLLGGPWVPVPRPVLAGLARSGWRSGLYPLHPGWLTLADRVPLADTTRARTVLGWAPRHPAPDALAELVAGMRAGAGAGSAALAPSPAASPRARRHAVHPGRPSHQSQA